MKRNKLLWFKKCMKALTWVWKRFPFSQEFGSCGKNVMLQYPLCIYCPQSVYIEENVKIAQGIKIINSPSERVVIKKYSAIAVNCTIVTNNHRSTVTIPHFLLGASHINDKSTDVVIEEDVWIGANVTILSGVKIGRGAIVGATSLVTKDVPPYALVIGNPATIVKKKFSNLQILEHEKSLYPEPQRMTIEQLEELDRLYFQNKGIYGTTMPQDKESLSKIEKTKKLLHFIEPDLGE